MNQRYYFLNKCMLAIALALSLFTLRAQPKCPSVSHKGQVFYGNLYGKGVDQVKIVINGVGQEVSSNGGNFVYKLAECPGNRVRVQAIKDGLSVVNHVELFGHVLENNLSRGDLQFKIIVCSNIDIEKYRIQYYSQLAGVNINRTIDQIKSQKAEAERLIVKVSQSNRNEVIALTRKVDSLNKIINLNLNNKEILIGQVAEIFSKVEIGDIDSVYISAFHYYQQGRLDDALKILSKKYLDNEEERLIKSSKKIQLEKQVLIQKILLRGNLFRSKLDFDSAVESYETALRLDSSNFNVLYTYCEILISQRKYMYVEKWLKKTYELSRKENTSSASSIDNLLATFYMSSGNIAKAELYLKEAINDIENDRKNVYLKNSEEKKEIIDDIFSNRLAALYNNLSFLHSRKNSGLALEYAKKSLTILYSVKNKDDNQKIHICLTINTLSNVLTDLRRDDAKDSLKKALSILRPIIKKDSLSYLPVYALLVNNIGYFYETKGKLNLATSLYIEASKYREYLFFKNPNEYRPLLAQSYVHIANVYKKRELLKMSEDFYDKALIFYEKLFEENSYHYGIRLGNVLYELSSIYISTKREEKANLFYKRYLELQ